MAKDVEITEFYSPHYALHNVMWKSSTKRKCNHDFLQKMNIFFRQINVFAKEVIKELISRKFFELDTFQHSELIQIVFS